jgi:translin
VVVLISSKDLKQIQESLTSFDEIREKMLAVSRVATRLSDWSIIQMHRNDMERAEISLKEAKEALVQIRDLVKNTPELRQTGSVLVAYQEYVEALLLRGLLKEGKLASLKEVDVEPVPYILGILDLIGELRRVTLNHLRRGKGNEADKTLKVMEELYEAVLTLDHTAIVPTFRVKADAARRIIESTRGDVITEIRRMSLEEAIRDLHDDVKRRTASA